MKNLERELKILAKEGNVFEKVHSILLSIGYWI